MCVCQRLKLTQGQGHKMKVKHAIRDKPRRDLCTPRRTALVTIYMPIFVKIGLFLLSQSGKRQTCSLKIAVLVYIILISLSQKWSYVA